MFMENRSPVQHVVDAGTGFQAARFLLAEDVASVWNTFLECWTTVYTNHPDKIHVDQGSVFTSKTFQDLCAVNSIEITFSGTESHNSLGKGERWHSLLRRTFEKLSIDYPRLPKTTRLALAVKAGNDVTNSDGLVPSLLVFGVLPKLPDLSRIPSNQRERFRALAAARKEYEKAISQQCIRAALNRAPPQASNYTFVPGDNVYVYREKLKHWTGPHIVAETDGKSDLVHIGETTGPRQFNVSLVKPSLIPPTSYFIRADDYPTPFSAYWTKVLEPKDPRVSTP